MIAFLCLIIGLIVGYWLRGPVNTTTTVLHKFEDEDRANWWKNGSPNPEYEHEK